MLCIDKEQSPDVVSLCFGATRSGCSAPSLAFGCEKKGTGTQLFWSKGLGCDAA